TARLYAAQAAHHVAVMRHHLARPQRRVVETLEVRFAGDDGFVLHLVENEVTLAALRHPARAAQEARYRQPLRHVLVRMPVVELRPHAVSDVAPDRDCRFAEHQQLMRASARRFSGVVPGSPKNSRYAGICSNSMSVPTCTRQPRACAALRNGVISSLITTSPTTV